MKLLVFLFCFLLVLTSTLHAQKSTTLVDGPEMKCKKPHLEDVIGSINGQVVICRREQSGLFLELLDQNAAIVKSVELSNLEYEGSDRNYIDAFILNKRLYVRFAASEKATKTEVGIIDEYDPTTLEVLRNVSIEKTNMAGSRSVYWFGMGLVSAKSELSESGFYVSYDENFAVDYSSAFEEGKDKAEMIFMCVYDKNMNEVWKKEYVIPYSSELFRIMNVVVDDMGNTYLFGKESTVNAVSPRKVNANQKYHVLSFSKSGAEVRDTELRIDGSFITDAAIGITSEGRLIASGFYGFPAASEIDGFFSMMIDIENGETIFVNKTPFEKDFIQLGMTDFEKQYADKQESKGENVEVPGFNLDQLLLMPDGGWVMMAEQHYISYHVYTTIQSDGTRKKHRDKYYNFDDIIVVRMNAKGEIIWKTKVDKYQSAKVLNARLSYAWFNCNETFYVVYNNTVTGQVVAEVIAPDGIMKREAIAGGWRDDFNFWIKISARTKNCQLLLFSSSKGKYRFSMLNAG